MMFFKELLYRGKHIYHFCKTGCWRGFLSQWRYRFPQKKLKIIAITGTDGKTTSATLLYWILKQTGHRVGLISTVAAYIGDRELETGFHVTTPNPRLLNKILAQMVAENIEYVVVEATSHGIYQHRLWGIRPFLAGLTNISHEHLDYHLNMENYWRVKASFLARAETVILNSQDQYFAKLKKFLEPKVAQIFTYSLTERLPNSVRQAINQRFSQNYNRLNARLVYRLAQVLSIDNVDFIRALKSFPGVKGRMEKIPNRRRLKIFVDFAHTPNALRQALSALRRQLLAKQKLIAVYGAAGARDQSKRPLMGKAGVELADLVVLTSEDPRQENPWSIIRQMKEQLSEGHDKIVSIADRREAIAFALNKLARRGDIVAIFGKGHEKSFNVDGVEYPWSDGEIVKEVLSISKK